MKFKIENGFLEMQGFDIDDKILISEADEVDFLGKRNGVYKKAKGIKVLIPTKTLISWIDDYGLLEGLGLEELEINI